MKPTLNRRQFFGSGLAAAAGAAVMTNAPASAAPQAAEKRYQNGRSPWPICLDTATIRPSSLRDKVRIAAAAGYDAIEPWDGELRDFEAEGGNLEDLGKEIRDLGLFVPSVIGLWNGISDQEEHWDENLEATRDRLRMVSAIGAEHVQVIPRRHELDGLAAAKQYRRLLEMGLNDYNVNPALVFVTFLPSCRRLSQAAAIAMDADHPKAKIIPDVFHMHITHSGFENLRHIHGDFIAIYQFNDAPAEPGIDALEDKHRVYPGDGILPLEKNLRDLKAIGFTGCVSLELYNPEYWEQDHETVAKTGLEKTVTVIEKAGV